MINWQKACYGVVRLFLGEVAWLRRLDVADIGPHRLVIDSESERWVFDRRQRCIIRNGRARLHFEDVAHIEVRHLPEDSDKGRNVAMWSVTLYRQGLHASWCVGRTPDDAQASIVAARIHDYLQVRVISI